MHAQNPKDDVLTTALLLAGVVTLFWLALALTGCSAPVYQRQNVLAEQIIYPHPEHSGLVNRACLNYSGDTCKVWRVEEYDLADPHTRQNLGRMRFLCDVGGRLFHPCPDKNGLCRVTYGKRPVLGLIGKRPREEEFISLGEPQGKKFLIQARTLCSRWGAYDAEVTP